MRSLAWVAFALVCLPACLDFDQFRGPDGGGGEAGGTVSGSTTSSTGGDPSGGTGGTGGEPATTSTGGMGGEGGAPALGPCIDGRAGVVLTDDFQGGPHLTWISTAGLGVFMGNEVRIDSVPGSTVYLSDVEYDVILDDCFMTVEVTAPSAHGVLVHWLQSGGPLGATIYITNGMVAVYLDGADVPLLDTSAFSVGQIRFRSEGPTLFIETGDGTSWIVRAEIARPAWMDAEGVFAFGASGSGAPDQPKFDNVNPP